MVVCQQFYYVWYWQIYQNEQEQIRHHFVRVLFTHTGRSVHQNLDFQGALVLQLKSFSGMIPDVPSCLGFNHYHSLCDELNKWIYTHNNQHLNGKFSSLLLIRLWVRLLAKSLFGPLWLVVLGHESLLCRQLMSLIWLLFHEGLQLWLPSDFHCLCLWA